METALVIRQLAHPCLKTTQQIRMVADSKTVRITRVANKAVKTTEVESKTVVVAEMVVLPCPVRGGKAEVESLNK